MTIAWWVDFYFRSKWLYVLRMMVGYQYTPKPTAIPPSVCEDQMALAMHTSAVLTPLIWELVCGVLQLRVA